MAEEKIQAISLPSRRESISSGLCGPMLMMRHFQQEYRKLKASPPGKRFQSLHRRRHQKGKSRQPWLAIAGVFLIVVGIVLLFVPGPGIVFLMVGFGLIAQEFMIVARALDALELQCRSCFEQKQPTPQNAPPPGLAP